MGHNPTKNPFRRARLGLDVGAQEAVDEYKARSVWSAWWQLDEKIRKRYFTRPERDFVMRWGAHMDELACLRTNPETDGEHRFVQVCMGHVEPQTRRERLWLFVRMVCRFERAVTRAARADLAEHDAAVLRAENRALKAKADHLERYLVVLASELRVATGEDHPGICNVQWATCLFEGPAQFGPPPVRRVMDARRRGVPVGMLTTAGIRQFVASPASR